MHGGRILRKDGFGYEQLDLQYENCSIQPKRGSLFSIFLGSHYVLYIDLTSI